MKKENIDKLYGMLTTEQQAKLTFKAILNNDISKANVICNEVPRFDYNAVDMNYSKTLEKIFEIASVWSIQYWRTNCSMKSALAAELAFHGLGDAREKECAELRMFLKTKLDAICQVLWALEDSTGVDAESILKFADVEGSSLESVCLDLNKVSTEHKEYYENHLAFFNWLITGEPLSPEQDAYFSNNLEAKWAWTH